MATTETLLDLISTAQDGVNSGVAPLLLNKSQISFGFNCSVRGGYLTHRPPVQKKTFIFQNPPQQAMVEGGFFQGAGYYRPDFGPQQLIAQISGHLFAFTEIGTGFTVTEISIPSDLNDPSILQVWMWQSEKWMIISDGSSKLPIFYDGVSSRRSYGPSVLLGTTNVNFNPPVIGGSVTISLTAPYTGPYNVPVLLNGAYYQPISAAPGGYNAVLTNVGDVPGNVIPPLSQIVVNPNLICAITQALLYYSLPPAPTGHWLLLCTLTSGGNTITSTVSINGVLWTPVSGTNNTKFVTVNTFSNGAPPPVEDGDQVNSVPSGGPVVVIGTTQQFVVIPAVGATVNVILDNAYTGAPNQSVYIGSNSYKINPIGVQPPSTNLTLINLTDVTTASAASPKTLLSVPELPAGRMGAYGLQQNWMSLTDGLTFIFSDISGSASGTPANNYRDAVLKTTQLSFGAGNFSIPSSGEIINAIWFTANLDSALGQGSLMIGTDSTIFSCLAPIDAAALANITSPILTESVIGNGPLGQDSTIQVNSDTMFRSNVGDGSLVLARRNFGSDAWGNKPISYEINNILDLDDKSLLSYGSSESFDNRRISLCSPKTTSQGIIHSGMTALNFDIVSTLRGSFPPSWEGLWTGLNITKIIKGRVNGVIRSFAFSANLATGKLELYELLHESSSIFQDNNTTRILWGFETAILFNKDIKPITELCQLSDGEIYLSKIKGSVDVEVQYRPDFYPCWTTWRKFTVCETDATNPKPGYRMRIGLGSPDINACETGNNRPLRVGNFFQFRVMITGSCQFMAMKVAAVPVPQPQFAPIECTVKPCQSIDCTSPDYFALFSLQGFGGS